jgi:hypothetical protein
VEVAINIYVFNISSNCDKTICLFYIIYKLLYIIERIEEIEDFSCPSISWFSIWWKNSFILSFLKKRRNEWPWWFTCKRINPFYKHFLHSDRAWYLRCLSYLTRMYRTIRSTGHSFQSTCANWANIKVVIISNPALTCVYIFAKLEKRMDCMCYCISVFFSNANLRKKLWISSIITYSFSIGLSIYLKGVIEIENKS